MSGLKAPGDAPERRAQTTYPFAKKIPARAESVVSPEVV